MRGGAFLKGKEGRVGFRKKVFPCRRDGEVEKIPFYGFFDTLLKQERWLPAEFLLELARIDGITHIKNRKEMTIQYIPSICVLSKAKNHKT